MSAWIVSDDHIDLLTTAVDVMAAYQGRIHTPAEIQGIFDMLRQSNYDSVNFRYSEHEEPTPRAFQRLKDFNVTAACLVQTRAAIDCYEYQSCEHPGWATSEAYKLIVNLGEWVDAKLTEGGWVKVPRRHSREGEEWLGMGFTTWGWERQLGLPNLDEYTPERLAGIRKANETMSKYGRQL
jgi:hypothetical protein